MARPSIKIVVWLCLAVAACSRADEPIAENLTESEGEAEFRQGGQLMSSYPGMGGGLYGAAGTGGFQYAGGSAGGQGGYANMIRNLYRPPSLGLTDKVKHWVKSFMNRRQFIKPYYNPSSAGLTYGDFGSKPVYVGNGYKAISVPLRQLQKYYKPIYATSDTSTGQYYPGASSAAGAAGVNYGQAAGSSGNQLYASESTSNGHFAGGSYGTGSESSSGIFGMGSGSTGMFPSGSQASGLYQGGSGVFGSYNPSESSGSALFNSPSGGIYGSSGSPSSGLFYGQGSSNFDASSGFNAESGNPFGSSSGYGSNAAAASSILSSLNGGSSSILSSLNGGSSSILSSLNGGSSGGGYGDLYASGANPAPSVYKPQEGGARGYGSKPNYGDRSSALYMSSGDDRNTDSYAAKSSKDTSFTVDNGRVGQPETSYSVSFQPAQSKSSFSPSGFQPVANAPVFQEKSSTS